ncbi:energy-coupling factor ABC transporter ATP-binding protein [Rodentibacter pneumotropicus]|uniref:Iron transport system ATP-binding protein n=1 Tax=Rodentibacter pneumotropicus TaxID=758 RepID=A0A3S4U148_9PAST|nr:energy-coupling factor ABC transporter ATP-binding protein [Rodentibacter pneumotropicus]NBH75048.1 ATP-binding cassette domain-containing protein [Rodentibacter pneumotropicus]OOF61700.1 cobalt ABC transporter ATP-binding protein [Rodentibacter pneumotropicus]OOF64476.1 cobalt ABC transporter ATP-binding protein [Rodentibacter pneumotropicus]THA04537.1 ATP-binding cassette domain-containing protein [Rodentibacter pneumotropicus]THA05583.1 ATP-binding cassette domain-containing protein [Rod
MLSVKNLCIERNNKTIIEDLTFHLEGQKHLFVQGDIGTGKTTLLLALLGFVPISKGEIRLFDKICQKEKDFAPFRGMVGICFQNADDQLFGPTVLDDVAFGPLNQQHPREYAYQLAEQQLERLGIAHLKNRTVHTLSGGEKNFTALAGVLAMQPKILLLDEPTNGLDRKNIEKLTALLRELGLPMLISSHHQGFIDGLADEIISL